MRINVRRLKSLLWIAALLAFLLAGWTFYDIFTGKKQGRYRSKSPDVYSELIWRDVDEEGAQDTRRKSYERERWEQLWLARMDGSREEVARPVDVEAANRLPPEPVLDPIEEVLEVGIVVWSPEPTMRFAAVEYLENAPRAPSKKRRLFLTEGEPLQPPWDGAPYHARVVSIAPQTVTFQWGDEEQTVHPNLGREGDDVPAAQFAVARVADPSAGLDGPPEETQALGDGHYVIGLKEIDAVRSDGGQELLESVTARTILPAGSNRSMLELKSVDPESVPAKFGFSSGDRIVSVNGIPMPSMSAAINWYKANDSLPVYDVLVERRGQQEHIVIHNKGT